MTVGAIVLAAGLSRRMGSNKLLALLDGKPLVAHVVDAGLAAGLPVLVVLGNDPEAIRAALGDRAVDYVIASDHAQGMGRSIAAGIAAVDWDAAIICLGDMPRISPDLLRLLAADATADAILIPTFEGRRGNPVLWGRNHFADLARLQGDRGGRVLFDRPLRELPWRDAGIFADVDTPEMLATLTR